MIKQKIIQELENPEIPDLAFLSSTEVLDVTEELLLEFLEQEKKDFENKLKIENSKITFELFEEESKLNFFWSLINHFNGVNSNDKLRNIIENIEPKLTEFGNEVAYSKRFFEMFEYCLENCKLDEEQRKIISDTVKNYKIRGINLSEEKQEELKKISLELSKLTTNFSNNVLDDEKDFIYFLENDEFLKELPESDLENAKELYRKKKGYPQGVSLQKQSRDTPCGYPDNCVHPDNKENTKKIEQTQGIAPIKGDCFEKVGYAFDSSASSYMAIMKYCNNSEIRKHFADAHSSFASSGKYDNRENVLKIINLKDKKAKLLGYKNYAELSLEFKMADSPEEVIDLLSNLSQKAKTKAKKEIEEIKDYFDLKELNSWDMTYYSRILKEKKYKLDDKKLKQYFEFENTKKALFDTVEKLYGIKMEKIPPLTPPSKGGGLQKTPLLAKEGLGVVSEGIELYKVFKDNKFISYFIGDYFYNENKRSGAWADELRSRFTSPQPSPEGEGVIKYPIVVNVMGFKKAENGKTLLTLGEVTTLFHEFGHALHSMLSKSKYSDLSGFGVEWDFVELPSQIMEKWASDDLTIQNVAKHYKTGEKLPDDLIEALKRLNTFGTGNFVLGQNTYSVTDMMFYSGEQFENIEELDKKYLQKVNELSIFKKDKDYKMYCSFSHIFAGGYSAGYYSYMWADILVDEVWSEFKKNGVYDKKIAQKFYDKILGAGSIKKAKDMFEEFMGRSVSIDAFLEEKGLK